MNVAYTTTREIPGTLRSIVIGCTIGAGGVFAGVAGVLYLNQHDLALAVGLGAMSAFWGGLGFGAMLGGTIHLVRHEADHSSPAPVPERVGRGIRIIEAPPASSAADATRVA